jgi:hypothetical protein
MALPDIYTVDFSPYRRDLVAEGLERMLAQHYAKCVLRQFVAVFLNECQDLYDALLDLQEKRTVYEAEEENLDALGRIVGAERKPWVLDEAFSWFGFDAAKRAFDRAPFWVRGAEAGKFLRVDDEQYRVDVINKAVKNHTLVGSLPEVAAYIKRVTGLDVSFEKTGPNTVRLYVPADISATSLRRITRSYTDNRVDEGYAIPYPATLSFSETVYLPKDWFIFDREERGFDRAPLAVLGTGKRSTTVFIYDREGHGYDQGKTLLLQQGA